MKNDVVFLIHEKFPLLSAADIAGLLDVDGGWVRATARRNELNLPKANERQSTDDLQARYRQLAMAEAWMHDTDGFDVDILEFRKKREEEAAKAAAESKSDD